MINLSISNIAWNNIDELQIFNILNQYNFSSIEIAPTKLWNDIYNCSDNDIKQYKKFVQNNKLNICAFQSLLFGESNLQVFDKNTWNKFFIRLERICYIAKLLDTQILVFGSPKNRIKQNNSIDIAYEFFNKVNNILVKYNCILGIEANPNEYNCDFLTTTYDLIKFISDLNLSNVQFHLDSGTIIMNNENINNILTNKLLPWHVHISAPYLSNIGDHMDFYKKLIIKLKELNYNKTISIEMKLQPIEIINECCKGLLNASK